MKKRSVLSALAIALIATVGLVGCSGEKNYNTKLVTLENQPLVMSPESGGPIKDATITTWIVSKPAFRFEYIERGELKDIRTEQARVRFVELKEGEKPSVTVLKCVATPKAGFENSKKPKLKVDDCSDYNGGVEYTISIDVASLTIKK